MREARDDFAAYLRGLLPPRRRSPGDDLISALIGVHDFEGSLTEDELIGLCMLLLIAGHETTRSLIGGSVLALLRHPAELTALAADPSLVEQAVEEVLRYDPPVQAVTRSALRSTEIAGSTIAEGSFVLMFVGAANRDPELCPDPDRFSVQRGVRRHLAFGHGIHFCLGAPLARLEAGIALRHLLPLLPRLRIAGEPQWKPNTVLRGLEHLWLEEAPAGGASAGSSRACGEAAGGDRAPADRGHAEQGLALRDHGLAVLGPVGVLPGDRAEVVDKGIHGLGDVKDLGGAVDLNPRAAEVIGQEHDADMLRVTARVAGLGSLRVGSDDDPALVVHAAGDRRCLRAAVLPRRDHDRVMPDLDEVDQLVPADDGVCRDCSGHVCPPYRGPIADGSAASGYARGHRSAAP